MKRIPISLCFLLSTFYFLPKANCQAQTQNSKLKTHNYTKYVNPFIGTGGHGHTFPGPTMPFGACQVGPDTRLEGWDGCSGYHYSDSVIYGFSHTHLSGTGCSDYGDILLMPVTKEMPLDKYQYASHFSHTKEKAQAGYYQVYLDDPKINVELTSTLHGGVHQYMYGWGSDMYIVLDLKHRDEVLDSKMEKVDDYTIRGYRYSKAWAKNQKVFYEITFSKPIEGIIFEPIIKGTNTTAINFERSLHAVIKFASNPKNQSTIEPKLMVKVAISGVDEEGAHKNMVAEMPHWDFEKYRLKAVAEWEKELSKIQINQFENGSMSRGEKLRNSENEKLTIFYTALYHCMIHPSIYNDVDGRYRGRDDKIHNTEGKFDYYTVFSLWDTYRALHPLLTILDKKRTNDFINTFIKQYEQGGRLPIWELSSNETNCMIGYHVVSVIWDAYNKGIRDFDVEKAYEAMTRIATHFSDYEGEGLEMKLKESAKKGVADSDALESYCKYGYVRSDDSHESVSKTLEYAYDDWCIAQMANALGKEKDYEYYMDRSHNWMNVYDPTTGFMRARKNGCLYEPYSPYTVDNNFTEANSWQYSFYVPHDWNYYREIAKKHVDLDDILKAKNKTEGREQADITGLMGQYAHGNEPSHHILFMEYGNMTKKLICRDSLVSVVLDSFYLNNPAGIIGNEDCGQMSAWYILTSLGFYTTCPGLNDLAYTYPRFSDVIIKTKDIAASIIIPDIDTNKHNKSCIYLENNIDSFSYLRKNSFEITYSQIDKESSCFIGGGKILKHTKPTSPYILCDSRNFEDSMKIKIKSFSQIIFKQQVKEARQFSSKKERDTLNFYQNKKYTILYKINDSPFKTYTYPFYIYENSKIDFYLIDNFKKVTSPIQTATFTKLPSDRKIILHNQYNPSYSAGGADALMDGIYGKLNWRAGDWQGYQGQDVEVIMVFDRPKEIKSIAANFLEDQNSWIFYPKEVAFYVSDDSTNWTLVETIPTNKSDHEEKTTISKFQVSNSKIQTLTSLRGTKQSSFKFVKMVAKNFGPMPQWHEGRGNPTFVFVDELEVK